jgi:hypothetical protein
MKSSFFALAFASIALASPVAKRAAYTDADILNYALTLEHLESKVSIYIPSQCNKCSNSRKVLLRRSR